MATPQPTKPSAPLTPRGEFFEELFDPGRNCQLVGTADRLALLVDGQAYFDAFVAAALNAHESLVIVGWDFHSRTRLVAEPVAPGVPVELGEFLNHLVRRRPRLRIRVLIWDFPLIFGTDREFPLFYGLNWKPHRHIDFCYDNTHPVGASHHQKFVVVDDILAFCGGIDLTYRRWDTCRHAAEDTQRTVDGDPYPPFHDVMLMVEGGIAHALGDLARERWRQAGGSRFHPTGHRPSGPAWPAAVPAQIDGHAIPVALSRTVPAPVQGAGIREVEALYVDLITRAERTLYIENQYFTSQTIGDALAARLAAADGPEIVVVLRQLSHGWLEALTMETLRNALLQRLRAADRYERLHVYYPFITGLAEGTCIDVHSKLMIVDDEYLRVGSANCANRSMGLDTECDLTVAARGQETVRAFIAGCRTQLLAEHLGATPEAVQAAIAREGSIAGAIAALRASHRTLEPLPVEEVSAAVLGLAAVGDPESPAMPARTVTAAASPTSANAHRRWTFLLGAIATLVLLVLLWRFTPLAQFAEPRRIARWAVEVGDLWWVPVALVAAYTPGSLIMFPRPLLTLFGVMAFGPWLGCALAMIGMLLAAFVTYVLGARMHPDTARRLAGARFERIIRVIRRHGLVAITALRLVPLAPFAVEGFIAGAFRIRLMHFMVGTGLGMIPGALTTTVFGNQITTALLGTGRFNVVPLIAVLAVVAVLTLIVKRWFTRVEHGGA